MEIYREIKSDKKQYLELLLQADEQESMIDRYLQRGTMYAADDDGIKTVCVVTDEGEGILEIKNISVHPDFRRLGYGKKMIAYIEHKYQGRYKCLRIGTGDSPLTIPFYEDCGFSKAFVVENFFIDNYDHPIF